MHTERLYLFEDRYVCFVSSWSSRWCARKVAVYVLTNMILRPYVCTVRSISSSHPCLNTLLVNALQALRLWLVWTEARCGVGYGRRDDAADLAHFLVRLIDRGIFFDQDPSNRYLLPVAVESRTALVFRGEKHLSLDCGRFLSEISAL